MSPHSPERRNDLVLEARHDSADRSLRFHSPILTHAITRKTAVYFCAACVCVPVALQVSFPGTGEVPARRACTIRAEPSEGLATRATASGLCKPLIRPSGAPSPAREKEGGCKTMVHSITACACRQRAAARSTVASFISRSATSAPGLVLTLAMTDMPGFNTFSRAMLTGTAIRTGRR